MLDRLRANPGADRVRLTHGDMADLPLPLALKVCAALLCAGLAILFLAALRARIATLPYDPYTKVQR